MNEMDKGKVSGFSLDVVGALRFKEWLCVPSVEELRKEIMDKAHKFTYVVHPGVTKMYRDMK